jgi:hypothetical protein
MRNMENRNYQCVLTFVFPNQQESYVIWDIQLYGVARRKDDFQEFILNGEKNGFGIDPINVYVGIFIDPKIMEVDTPLGKEMVLIGKHCLDIDVF